MYATYVYLTVLVAAFRWWLALYSDVSVVIQMGSAFVACMASSLLVMMGLYELTVSKKQTF